MFRGLFGKQPEPPANQEMPSSTLESSQQDEQFETVSSLLQTAGASTAQLGTTTLGLPGLNGLQEEGVQYLFIEENPFALTPTPRPTGTFGPFPMRTNSDKLLYGTGALYLMGLTSGGTYGFFRGLRLASGRSFKLKTNSVLNMVTRYGPFAANSAGVLAVTWTGLDYTLEKVRGKNDYGNHLSAAFLAGVFFKSTGKQVVGLFILAGLRPALVAGSLMASVVGAYGLTEHVQENGFTWPNIDLSGKLTDNS